MWDILTKRTAGRCRYDKMKQKQEKTNPVSQDSFFSKNRKQAGLADLVLQSDQEGQKIRDRRKYGGWKSRLQTFLQYLVLFVIALMLVFRFVVGVAQISGNSMEPTFRDGQTVWFYRLGDSYQAGDVICFRLPTGELLVKRIIAVGGDVVDLKDGRVYVNGARMDESSYAHGRAEPEEGEVTYPYTVPAGRYFVMGDNREDSVDSRSFKAIVREAVKGKLLGVKQ
ncbi:MAG: signal peptidase I [Lachnospiraceae bacterium]|nr:signal peptidase I [Lachnospiraceae bacterium]